MLLFFKILTLDELKRNIEEEEMPPTAEENNVNIVPETESGDNDTVTYHEERLSDTEEERILLGTVHTGQDVSVEEDGGHFNKNKDNQPGLGSTDEIQKVPQADLENPLEMGLGIEVEHLQSGW